MIGSQRCATPTLVRRASWRRATRSASTPSPIPTSPTISDWRAALAARPGPARPGRRDGPDDDLLRPPYSFSNDALDDVYWQLVKDAHDRRATSPCWPTSTRGLGAARRRRRSSRNATPKDGAGRDRPAARRRRRPLADRRRARPAHPAAAGAGVPLHHRQRRPLGAARRTSVATAGELWRGAPCSVRPRARAGSPPPWPASSSSPARSTLLRLAADGRGRRRHGRSRRSRVLGAAGARAGVGHRARLQREGAASRRASARWSASDHRGRDHRRRRRLHRRHRRHRRGAAACPNVRVIRQAERAASPPRSTPASGDARHDILVMVDGDTVFEPDTVRDAGAAVRRPARSARSPATPRSATATALLGRWQHIEYVIGFNLDRRMYDVAAAACRPSPARSARSAARRCCDVGGISDDTLAEDTDLTMAVCPGRLAGRLRGDAPGPGPRRPPRCGSCGGSATAGATAPCRRCGSTARALFERGPVGPLRPASACLYLALFQVLLPLLAPADRRLPALRRWSSSTRSRRIGLAGGVLGLAAADRGCTRSGWTGRRCGRCGRCRCSSSSTGS